MNGFFESLASRAEHLPIAKKIKLTYLPIAAIAAALGLFILIENIASLITSSHSLQAVELVKKLDSVAHNLAVERGLTAGYVGSGGEKGRSDLMEQREKANAALTALNQFLEKNRSEYSSQVQNQLTQLSGQTSQLSQLRARVDRLDKDADAFAFYSSLNKSTLDIIRTLANHAEHPDVIRSINALVYGLWLKERAGQERGAINGVFARGEYTIADIADIQFYITDQLGRSESLLMNADEEQATALLAINSAASTQAVENYRQVLMDAVSRNQTLTQNTDDWFAQSTERIKLIKVETDILRERTASLAEGIYYRSWGVVIGIVVFSLLLVLAMSRFAKGIADMLLQRVVLLTNALGKVEHSLDFKHRIPIKDNQKTDEVGQACQALNSLLDRVSTSIDEVCATMEKIGNGDFSARLTNDFHGDLETLKNGVNFSAAKVDVTMTSLGDVMDALHQGDFSARMSNKVEGAFKSKVDQAMTTTDMAFNDIGKVMRAVSQGDFSARVTQECRGQLAELKNTINQSVDSIALTLTEIKNVVTEQQAGNFKARIKGDFQGDLAVVKAFINQSMQSIDTALHEIGKVFSQLRKGDFSGHIDAALTGQLAQMKEDINDSMKGLKLAMNDIANIAESQKNGDLRARMQGNYQGTLKEISVAINDALLNLETIVASIKASSDHATVTAEELNLAINDLSKRTEGQAASLEEMSSSISVVNELSQEADAKIISVSGEIEDVAQEANVLLKTIDETMVAMENMRKSSQEITAITNMINEIAFQTNLLALNAAVEAARAGEQGRGFSVVAAEVRNLAQRSSQATADIKQLLDRNMALVDSCAKLTNQSSENMNTISKRVASTKELTKWVRKASKDQSSSIFAMKSEVNTLDRMTQENAAMVEEATAATLSVAEQSVSVNNALSYFKINA